MLGYPSPNIAAPINVQAVVLPTLHSTFYNDEVVQSAQLYVFCGNLGMLSSFQNQVERFGQREFARMHERFSVKFVERGRMGTWHIALLELTAFTQVKDFNGFVRLDPGFEFK